MIVHDFPQGSDQWIEARLGRPTASRFGSIIQPAKLGYSAGAKGYIAELLTEWATGYPVLNGSTPSMDRGTGMEDEAVAWYSLQRDVEVVKCGFVVRDDGRVGGSPDGLVGDDGGAEIKVPQAQTMMRYILYPGSLADEYRAQANGYLYLTGRKWWDCCAYSPVLPKVVERIERDDDFQAALHKHIGRFLSELDEGRRRLIDLGVKPAPSFRRQADPTAWEEAAASVQSSEEFVRELYDAREATEGELANLKLLMFRKGDVISSDEYETIKYVMDKKDGHAVLLWIRALENRA